MKKMVFLCLMMIVFTMNIYAAECEIVIDADSGRVLYGKNIHEKRLIASTTKIMTALVVINNIDIEKVVTVGDEVMDAYGSAIYIKPKERLKIKDLLYGLMLRSGNDAALVLAKNVGGSVDGFVNLMNETAKYIGMNDTVFSNPHGLDEATQNTSTVYDMAKLMREAMKSDTFRMITNTKKYRVKTNFNTYEWYNKNKLLSNYKYATGGKIGYTTRAKHTFVSSATKDGKNLIVATFLDGDRFNTHKNLYEKYFPKYEKYLLIDSNDTHIKYKHGYKTYTMQDFTMLLDSKEKHDVLREIILYGDKKKIRDGNIIGNMAIKLDGKIYKRVNIYVKKINYKEDFWSFIRKLLPW